MDRDMRRWVEECDHLQGVQVWTGADDAWGGFAAKYVEALRDEMGKMGIWTWGLEEERGRGSRVNALIEKCDAVQWLTMLIGQAASSNSQRRQVHVRNIVAGFHVHPTVDTSDTTISRYTI